MECVPRKASQDEVRLTQPQLSSNVMEIMDMLNGRSVSLREDDVVSRAHPSRGDRTLGPTERLCPDVV